MFQNLFIFQRYSTWEPASIVCNDEQGDLFYSAGPHRNQCFSTDGTLISASAAPQCGVMVMVMKTPTVMMMIKMMVAMMMTMAMMMMTTMMVKVTHIHTHSHTHTHAHIHHTHTYTHTCSHTPHTHTYTHTHAHIHHTHTHTHKHTHTHTLTYTTHSHTHTHAHLWRLSLLHQFDNLWESGVGPDVCRLYQQHAVLVDAAPNHRGPCQVRRKKKKIQFSMQQNTDSTCKHRWTTGLGKQGC